MNIRVWWKRSDKTERQRVADAAGLKIGTLRQIVFSGQTTTFAKAEKISRALHGMVQMDELVDAEQYGE